MRLTRAVFRGMKIAFLVTSKGHDENYSIEWHRFASTIPYDIFFKKTGTTEIVPIGR